MIRMPPYLDNCTSVSPRTTRCDGHAIYLYKTPAHRRFFYACVRHGWIAVVAILAALVLTGCSDIDSEERSAASLRDAIAQAQGATK